MAVFKCSDGFGDPGGTDGKRRECFIPLSSDLFLLITLLTSMGFSPYQLILQLPGHQPSVLKLNPS